MNRSSTLVTAIAVSTLIAGAGCSGCSGGAGPAVLGAESGSVAGIRWTVPRDWTVGPERPMRVATYAIPSTGGGEPAECAVFFFGGGQGGDVESNLQRWIEQFEPGAKPQRSTGEAGGLGVSRVRVDGTYLAPAGPMMESQGSKPGWRLLGAIVEAPEGRVFFKCTGPARTLEGGAPAFEALVASVRKESP